MVTSSFSLRLAQPSDLESLLLIESQCFAHDRLSRRSFKHWIKSDRGILLVAESDQDNTMLGYALTWCHRGTRLARLYSLAVTPDARGLGLGLALLLDSETRAADRGRLYMRLEVAKHNSRAIELYQQNNYRIFGEFCDYYEDHSDALRMQKTIAHLPSEKAPRYTPWYQQTTRFTCGPAALLMAMASLAEDTSLSQMHELDIWREATTVFMTTGHGGTHPIGLALAAHHRGFETHVWLSTREPLFVDGVRKDAKKQVITAVHNHFVEQAQLQGIELNYSQITQQDIARLIAQGYALLVLISTYQLDGRKVPHWVTITGLDEQCIYFHDPDAENDMLAIDCQHVPIARVDFDKMSTFGSNRLRTAVALKRKA